MGTWLGRMLGTAGCLLFLAGSGAAASPTAAQLAALVRALDAEDFSTREAASRQLIACGDAAIEPLANSFASAGPEAAWRATLALEQIALTGSDATLQRVAAALLRLSQSGKPGLAALTTELSAKQARLRRDRAMMRVRALGGKFGGDEESPAFLGLAIVFGGAIPLIIEPEEFPIGIELEGEAPAAGADAPRAAAAAPAGANLVVGPAPPPDGPPPPVAEDRLDLAAAIDEAFVADLVAVEIEPSPSDAAPGAESLVLTKAWTGGDAALATLREVPGLVSLSIDHAPLTDAALDHLALLADLAELDIRGTPFTSAGLYKFRERKPATRVYAIGTAMLGVHAPHHGKCELTGVSPGSGAFAAGLKPADEIVAVAGRQVRDFGDLTIAVYTCRPGDKLKVEFHRSGEKHTTEVTLQERKELAPR